jgi:hypothetical protein
MAAVVLGHHGHHGHPGERALVEEVTFTSLPEDIANCSALDAARCHFELTGVPRDSTSPCAARHAMLHYTATGGLPRLQSLKCRRSSNQEWKVYKKWTSKRCKGCGGGSDLCNSVITLKLQYHSTCVYQVHPYLFHSRC